MSDYTVGGTVVWEPLDYGILVSDWLVYRKLAKNVVTSNEQIHVWVAYRLPPGGLDAHMSSKCYPKTCGTDT